MEIIHCPEHGVQGRQWVSRQVAHSVASSDNAQLPVLLTVDRAGVDMGVFVHRQELALIETILGSTVTAGCRIEAASNQAVETFLDSCVTTVCSACFGLVFGGSGASAEQASVCSRHGMLPCAPEAMVAVAMSTLGQQPLHGFRHVLQAGENVGWFFHCGEYSDADGFYQPLHAAHLPTLLPLATKFLHLPPGARFIADGSGYEDVWLDVP